MPINLTPEQETWIKAHVATGDFASVEEAARELIDDRIAELTDDRINGPDDMTWARPLVDEARAAVARGDVLTLEEHRARHAARRAPEIVARVVITEPADSDSAEIIRDLAEQARELVADRHDADFDALYRRLESFAESGSPRPALGRFVRIGLVSPYTAIHEYIKSDDTVTILRIVHGRRRISRRILSTPSTFS